MQIAARKPTRTLWQSSDAEGRDTYEWRANRDGTPVEPSSCAHYSKRQADISWRENNPPGTAGRPSMDRPAKEGNKALAIRFDDATLAKIAAKGGTSWVRQLIESALDA